MRLYSIQSIEVVAYLHKYKTYFPTLEKSVLLQDESDRISFLPGYSWMIKQYNDKKNNDFSSQPVWWYTNLKQITKQVRHLSTNEVIITAEVPEKEILLYDADLWEEGPFMRCYLGWGGCTKMLSDTWDEETDALFDSIYDLYKKNKSAMEETWKEIFNIRKSDGTQRIHAVTSCIELYWMLSKPIASSKEMFNA